MKKYFIDSNIFLRFFDGSSDQHKECKELFRLIENGRIKAIICSVVLLEVYFVLKRYYKLSKKNCQQRIVGILELKNLYINDNFDYKEAMSLFCSSGIKLPDCLIASLNFLQNKGKIISYDKHFDKLGVKRIEPKSKPLTA